MNEEIPTAAREGRLTLEFEDCEVTVRAAKGITPNMLQNAAIALHKAALRLATEGEKGFPWEN